MPAPRLIIRRLDPRRHRNMRIAAGAGLLLVFLGGAVVGRYWDTEQRVAQSRYQELLDELQHSYAVNNQQRERIAALESSEQVARNANRELRDAIAGLQDQLAAVQNDLRFYQGLAGAGSGRPGLAVHQLLLAPTDTPHLYDYTLTLAQNLEQAKLTRGRVELWIEGTRDGEILRVGLDQMRPQKSDGLAYEFKYFQVLDGALLLPENLVPDRVEVRLIPENGQNETVEADFAWPTVVKRASSFDSNANRGATQP